jgi:hypothetical protein
LEFTLQRVLRPHKLKLELQPLANAAPDGAWKSFDPGFYKDVAPTALKIIPVATYRRLVTDYHFPPGVAAFGRKPHSSILQKNCGGLPTAATTASGPPAIL